MGPVGHPRQIARFREREERILAVARRILVREGFDALSMDTVAEAVHWSKGTVYQHFKSKEDILTALMAESLQRKAEFFQRAALFRGRPRERMMAIGIAAGLFDRLHPEHVTSFTLIHANASRARVSDTSCQKVHAGDSSCRSIATGIVRDAVAAGDLVLAPGMQPEEITFALASMALGARTLASASAPVTPLEMPDAERAIMRSSQLFLDGLGWKPRSGEWDYDATRRRVLAEVFPEEAKILERT